jgi:hypothetical protein
MGAGYDAMGKRTGEQVGESLRELARAQLEEAQIQTPATNQAPPDIAAPAVPPDAPH